MILRANSLLNDKPRHHVELFIYAVGVKGHQLSTYFNDDTVVVKVFIKLNLSPTVLSKYISVTYHIISHWYDCVILNGY